MAWPERLIGCAKLPAVGLECLLAITKELFLCTLKDVSLLFQETLKEL